MKNGFQSRSGAAKPRDFALHAVRGMGTIKDAAIAAATNRVFLHPRYVPFRHFSLNSFFIRGIAQLAGSLFGKY